IRLCELDERAPAAAADVAQPHARRERAVEAGCRQPSLHEQVVVPTGGESLLAAIRRLGERALRHAAAGAERLDEALVRSQVADEQLGNAAEEHRAALVGEDRSAIGGE